MPSLMLSDLRRAPQGARWGGPDGAPFKSYGPAAPKRHPQEGGDLSLGDGRRLGPQHLDAAADLLDRGMGALGSAIDLEGEFGLEFALAEDLHAVARPRHHAGGDQRFDGDRLPGVKTAGVDRNLHAAEIDLVEIEWRGRIEAALGQATMERHLAALEAFDANARTRRLAFAAATRLLALARANAASDPDAVLGGTGIVLDFVEFHGRVLNGRRRRARDARLWRSFRA